MNELTLLRKIRPTEEELDTARLDTAWTAVMERVRRPELRRAPTRVPPGRWRTVLGVAAAAIVIAVVPALWPTGPGGASPAAAAALRRAADVAAARAALPAPGPGQYLFASTQERSTLMYVPGHGLDNFLFTESSTVESWTASDGSGRVVTTPGGVTFPTSADQEAWDRAGRPELQAAGPRDERSEGGELYVLDLSGVPTDADELLAAIERREILGGDDADWVTFQIIGELLHLTYSSPEHRAALYEVAANFPGVNLVGHVTDAAGRRGVAVSYGGGGHRQEMIFDPRTAELLGERDVLVDQEEAGVSVGPGTWPGTIIGFAGPPGTVVFSLVYLETAVVDSIDERP
jgi:hypothetical protein